MDKIKLLVVEPSVSLANSLRRVLDNGCGPELVGHAPSATYALGLLACSHPDVVVMDVLLPDMGVLEAISLAIEKSPQVKIILLADHSESRYLTAALRYGASACLRKDQIATQLVPLIRQIAHQIQMMKLLGSPATRARRNPIIRTTIRSHSPEVSINSKEKILSHVSA